MIRPIYFVILALALPFFSHTFANLPDKRRDTPDFWMCTNRSKINNYEFARARYVCDLHHFIDPQYVEAEFSQYIFDEQADIETERRRVMTELYALIRDTAEYFIKERDPNVSQEELDWFILSSFAIGNQETYWSQYRYEPGMPVQYMRGDFGHGHGIFQVDDRWHFSAVTDGRAANIVYNMIYSLEEYYTAWKRAKSISCVDSPTSYMQISRAAYAAYNGGPSKICRWTNPNDRWAQNDKGYLDKITNVKWERYIDDFDSPASIDVACIAEGREGCQASEPGDPTPMTGKLYIHSDGPYCVVTGTAEAPEFKCVEQSKDATCLVMSRSEDFSSFSGRTTSMPEDFESTYEFTLLERQAVCESSVQGLSSIGEAIELHKNINLRKTPGGQLLTTIPKTTVAQVLDYETRNYKTQDRYYHIKVNGVEGYIYAGKASNQTEWTSVSSDELEQKYIASIGDNVLIKKDIMALDKEENQIIISSGTVIEVGSISINGINNSIYYSDSKTGAHNIFVGHTSPTLSVEEYSEITDGVDTDRQFAKLSSKTWWKRLRACASSSCKYTGKIKGPRMSDEAFEVVSESGSYYQVKQGSIQGWIKKKYVVLI